jgi:hypothetical protein
MYCAGENAKRVRIVTDSDQPHYAITIPARALYPASFDRRSNSLLSPPALTSVVIHLKKEISFRLT